MGNLGVKIKTISIKSYKCFKNVDINCTKEDGSVYQWTVLLGNNNTGKTSLLKAIANIRPVELKNRLTGIGDKNYDFVAAAIYDRSLMNDFIKGSYVRCDIDGDIISKPKWGYSFRSYSAGDKSMCAFQIYAYGVSRYPSKTSLSESICDSCASLFYQDKYLINIEEWLMQLDYAAKNHQVLAEKRLSRIKELLCGNLFPEILNFKFESTENLHNYTLFQTKDGWFRYTQLGYGYQSMLSWIVDLCKRMIERYPESETPFSESAIVLVDEIDLHLHPQWQRDIIPFLSKAFPNVQFIVTTHSPLVIQSMEEVNLYVLQREENKVKVERSDFTNFIGWTVEEILRDTMKLESDIHSDTYQNIIKTFDKALDENDRIGAEKAFEKLCRILHPQSTVRRILKLQLEQML